LLVVTAVALVAGATVTRANTRAAVTLKVLAQSNGQGNPQLQAVFDKFEKANPDIKIDATYLPIGETYANTLRTQLRGGNAPDVFYVTPGSGGLQSLLPFAKAGYVADLSKRAWANKIPLATSAKPLYWWNKKLWGVPIDVVPVGVLYHPDVLSDLGLKVPATMSQLLSNCRTAKGKGKFFLNVAGASAQNAGLLASVVAGSYVLQGSKLEREAAREQGHVRRDARVAGDAPADRGHEERRVLPARVRSQRQHPRDARVRLRTGRELDASVFDHRPHQELQPEGAVQLLRHAG